jgi:hypothetical protein
MRRGFIETKNPAALLLLIKKFKEGDYVTHLGLRNDLFPVSET